MNHGGWGTTRIKQTNTCHPERRHYSHGLCRTCYRNTPEFKAMRRAYYERHSERFKGYTAQAKERRTRQTKAYGISREAQLAMLADQGGLCAICGNPPRSRGLSIDHNHATGEVRGMLCGPCNRAIGLFRDDPSLLLKAVQYLYERDHSLSAAAPAARGPQVDGPEALRCAGVPSTLREDGARCQSSAEGRALLPA